MLATPQLNAHYRAGLGALTGQHSARVNCINTRRLTGSIHLDSALKQLYPDDPRWDYGIAYRNRDGDEKTIWAEVHPASSHHVNGVLNKLAWLKEWLRESAPQLRALGGEFHWVATGSVDITRNSRQAKQLAESGLKFPSKQLKIP